MQQSIISLGVVSIKNAQKAKKRMVEFPTNKMMNALVDLLKQKGLY